MKLLKFTERWRAFAPGAEHLFHAERADELLGKGVAKLLAEYPDEIRQEQQLVENDAEQLGEDGDKPTPAKGRKK
jgi:hypothetical protein